MSESNSSVRVGSPPPPVAASLRVSIDGATTGSSGSVTLLGSPRRSIIHTHPHPPFSSPVAPSSSLVGSPPPASSPSLPSSALASRTGQALVELLKVTNHINARRGSTIVHAIPNGINNTPTAPTTPFVRSQPVRRSSMSVIPVRRASLFAPSTNRPTDTHDTQLAVGNTHARRFSMAVGTGIGGQAVMSQQHDPLAAAKLRALTTTYLRRGGGISIDTKVSGIDFRTGKNQHMRHDSHTHSHADGVGDDSNLNSPLSPNSKAARVVMEEDGVVRNEYHGIRRMSRLSIYGSQQARKLSLAHAIDAPIVKRRASVFRAGILEQSALADAPQPKTIEEKEEEAATVAAIVAPTPTPPSSTAMSIAFDWREVLSRPSSLRSDSDLASLGTWLVSTLKIGFFTKLKKDMLRQVCRVLTLEQVPKDEWLFRQGERGDKFYVVVEGKVVIVIDKALRQGEIAGGGTRAPLSPMSGPTSPQALSVARAFNFRKKSTTRRSTSGTPRGGGDGSGSSGGESGGESAGEGGPTSPTSPNGTRRMARAAKLLAAHTRSRRAISPSDLVVCTRCGADGHAESECKVGVDPTNSPPPVSSDPNPSPILAPFDPKSATLEGDGSGGGASNGPTLTLQQLELGLTSTEVVVAEASVGAGFGEVALASKSNTRQASVKTVQSCIFLCLNKSAYDLALKTMHEEVLNFRMSFVRELFLFHRWSYEKVLQFSLCLTEWNFRKDHCFYQQRSRTDLVYFIVSGKVKISLTNDGGRSPPLFFGGGVGSTDSSTGGGIADDPSSLTWIGSTYLKDESEETRLAEESHRKMLEEQRRSREIRKQQRRWKSKKLKGIKSRYMNTTVSQRERARIFILPPSASELDAQRRREDGEHDDDDDDDDDERDSRRTDSDYTTTTTDTSSSTDTSRSSDDEFTRQRRAERKRLALKARARAKALKRNGGKYHEPSEQPTGTHLELSITDSHYGRMPRDSQYAFFKVHFQQTKSSVVTSSNTEDMRILRVSLKPQRLPQGPLREDGTNMKEVEYVQLLNTFDLFAGNQSCPYPTKLKHTWSSNTDGKQVNAAGMNRSVVFTRTIRLNPDDPNFSSGWFYFSVFLGGAEVSPASSFNDPAGMPYELFVSNESVSGRQWSRGSRYVPSHMFDLATLGPMDFFGAEEVVAQHEAATMATNGGGNNTNGNKNQHLCGSLDSRIDYFGVGRICSAVVVSPTATILTIPKDQFMNHVRGQMLKELKLLLRKQLLQRYETLQTQLDVVAQTLVASKKKTGYPPRHLHRKMDHISRRIPLKPSVPIQRPMSAQPLSKGKEDAIQHAETGEIIYVDSTKPSLDPTIAAGHHHRPNLSMLGALTQGERTQIEYAYRQSLLTARLRNEVESLYISTHPDARVLTPEDNIPVAPPTTNRGASRTTKQQQQLPSHRKQPPRALWTLDAKERERARTERRLQKLKQERDAETIVFKKETNTSNKLLLRPSSADVPSSSRALKHEERLQLMPGDSEQSMSLVTNDTLSTPSTISTSTSTTILESSSNQVHPLNTIPTFQIVPLQRKRELLQQNRMALQLFGKKLHPHPSGPKVMTTILPPSAATTLTPTATPLSPRRNIAHTAVGKVDLIVEPTSTHHLSNLIDPTSIVQPRTDLSQQSEIEDGPIYGLAGSSTQAGTLSRAGMGLAIKRGLRNHWQNERHAVVIATKAHADASETLARESPFSDPSLYNPWLYIPSLYDSASQDVQLNQLAISLGIPQPKPAPQPKDKSNRRWEDELMEADAATKDSTKSQRTVEEALRLAEIDAMRSEKVGTNGGEHSSLDVAGSSSSFHPQQVDSPNPDAADRPVDASSSSSTFTPVCPIPNSLWQSERIFLPAPPPVKPEPYISKTILVDSAPHVIFQPPEGSVDVPKRFQNSEKRRVRDQGSIDWTTIIDQTTTMTTTMASVNNSTPSSSSPFIPHAPSRSRPGSATMLGSFILRQTSAAAAAKAKRDQQRQQQQQQQEHNPTQPDPDESVDPTHSLDVDDSSTIFSLTQLGSIDPSDDHTSHSSEHQQAVMLHPSVAISEPLHSQTQHTSIYERAPSPPPQPAPARAFQPQGNRFLALDEQHVDAIPQRQDTSSDARARATILAVLADERAQRTLVGRIRASAQSARSAAGATPSVSQSARVVLAHTHRQHAQTHRSHRHPPSIPSKTQPSSSQSKMGWEAQLHAKSLGMTQPRKMTQPFRHIGRRQQFQFHTIELDPNEAERRRRAYAAEDGGRNTSHYAESYPEPYYAAVSAGPTRVDSGNNSAVPTHPLHGLWDEVDVSAPFEHTFQRGTRIEGEAGDDDSGGGGGGVDGGTDTLASYSRPASAFTRPTSAIARNTIRTMGNKARRPQSAAIN